MRFNAVAEIVTAVAVINMMCLPIASSLRFGFIPLLKGAHAFALTKRSLFIPPHNHLLHVYNPNPPIASRVSLPLQCGINSVLASYHQYPRRHHIHLASNSDGMDETESAALTMDNIYRGWTLEDDKLLYDNKHLSTVRLASLLGRGMHGVEARLKKLTNVDGKAYARLFGAGNEHSSEDSNESEQNNKLTPVKEVLRRIQWDPTLPSASFTILHYDRVEDTLCETPYDAPNDSISGRETKFVNALPEHRIEGVKYLDRTVWDKEMRLDCVFGSMNGNGETIDQVIDSYDDWKREKEQREERNRLWQIEILKELHSVLGEHRVGVLKDLSSNLMRGEWDTEGVTDYVKKVVSLYHDAKREIKEQSIESSETDEERGNFIQIVDFLYLFSDLVALLSDALLREEILKEVEQAVSRSQREDGPSAASNSSQPGALPDLNEDDLEEKFVKGSGAGGQKVNKTSNRVILVHIPTQMRIECQDTRSLQQNRKIARKRLRLKVDAFINGESSRTSQKATAAVTKKAKNKSRNKRRRQQKKKSEKED